MLDWIVTNRNQIVRRYHESEDCGSFLPPVSAFGRDQRLTLIT
jgi:hypothetical protein